MTAKNSSTYLFESELVQPVARFLRRRSFLVQCNETPFFEHRMDVCAYSSRMDRTIAVELKLTDWTRAIEQAIIYQLCADLVYVAMPSTAAKRVDKRVLSELGIGLLAVAPHSCRVVVAASQSAVLRKHYHRAVVSFLRRGVSDA